MSGNTLNKAANAFFAEEMAAAERAKFAQDMEALRQESAMMKEQMQAMEAELARASRQRDEETNKFVEEANRKLEVAEQVVMQERQARSAIEEEVKATKISLGSMMGDYKKEVRSVRLALEQPKFTGGEDDDIDTFMAKLLNFLKLQDVHNDEQQVLVAVSCLKGSAEGWWYNNPGLTSICNNLEKFKAKLSERWCTANTEMRARDKLHELKLTGSSMQEFIQTFAELSVKIREDSEASRVHQFMCKLDRRTQAHLRVNKPKTLDEAMHMALGFDTAQPGQYTPVDRSRMDVDTMSMTQTSTSKVKQVQHTEEYEEEEEIDVNAFQGRSNTYRGRNRGRGQENPYRGSGRGRGRGIVDKSTKCFKCQGYGHIAAVCATK